MHCRYGKCKTDQGIFGMNYGKPWTVKEKGMFWRNFYGPTNSLKRIILSVRENSAGTDLIF